MRYVSIPRDSIDLAPPSPRLLRPTESSEVPSPTLPAKVLWVRKWEIEEKSVDWLLETEKSQELEVLFLCGLFPAQLSSIRKKLDLHPILLSQCSDSIFTSTDSLISTPSHAILSTSFISDDLSTPVILKLILRKRQLIVISSCFPRLLSDILTTREELDGFEHVFAGEALLILILQAISRNLNEYVHKLTCETHAIVLFSHSLSATERIDFIQRINISKKHLYLIKEVITGKSPLISSLKTANFPPPLTPYLESLSIAFSFMCEHLSNCEKELKLAETLYEETVSVTKTTAAAETGRLFRVFTKLGLLCAPLFIIGAYNDLNNTTPYSKQGDLRAFAGTIGISVLVVIVLSILVR